MKKYATTLILAAFGYSCLAQNSNFLVRHDTTVLKVTECEWIIKSLAKNDPSLTASIGKSVTQLIFIAIEKGKLKAFDPQTNKPIPGKEIETWNMDSIEIWQADSTGGDNSKFVKVKQTLNTSSITQIRIYQDWYFDISRSKFQAEIKWIELVREVYASSGIFMGFTAFCKIYY